MRKGQCGSASQKMGTLLSHGIGLLLVQVASSSRAGGPRATHANREQGGSTRTQNVGTPQRTTGRSIDRPGDDGVRTDGQPQVLAIRAGDPLPDGYMIMVRGTEAGNTSSNPVDILDLTTHPEGAARGFAEDGDHDKRKSSDGRPSTRTTNKRVQSTFVKEVKASLAGGRAPALHVGENETHLKARWHSAAKEAAYKFLDLRKEGWKSYSIFDKNKVHKAVTATFEFEPPLDPKSVDKYLSGHLRSSRAVWKAHWLRHGDDNRHPNCPEEAWDKLIQWWPTEQCREESAQMASRRKLVHNRSKTGRTQLVDRMDDQVSVSEGNLLYVVGASLDSQTRPFVVDCFLVHAATMQYGVDR